MPQFVKETREIDERAWRLPGEKHPIRKYRTEATERDGGFVGGVASVDAAACVRETSLTGKASHRGHRGHGGGMEIFLIGSFRERGGLRARNKLNGESIAQRSQRSR